MTTVAIDDTVLAELTAIVSGPLLRPTDALYEEVRRVHNGMIDKRPAIIAQCHGTADVVAAVNFARERNMEIAVRGGGHNVAGNSVCDDGIMMDLSPMKGMWVDAGAKTARAQGGVTWGQFNRETQLYGLGTTGGIVSTTGVVGLTLGGGLGWLMGKHGMAVDNVRSAEIVTADGQVRTASESENPDLFWAIRGGGGNFGIVSSIEFNLYPVGPTITGGLAAFPFDRAREILRFYREFTADAPDELETYAALGHAPDGSGMPIVAIVLCHSGDLQEGERAVKTIRDLGPVVEELGALPYTVLNMMNDAEFPKGALNYWKSGFLKSLSDDAIETVIEAFGSCPSMLSQFVFEHFHGAAARVDPSATAFPMRQAGHNFLITGEWLDPAESDTNIAWVRDAWQKMTPHLADWQYVNYMSAGESGDPAEAAYGQNYARLKEIKRKYDPQNLFRLNQNIRP